MITVARRFHRSVSLDHDWQDSKALDGYILSPLVRDCATRVLHDLFLGQTRSWALVGPYGSGKSAFGLFLSKLLNQQASQARVEFLSELDDPELLGVLSKSARRPLVSVAVMGERVPVAVTVLRALDGVLTAFKDNSSGAPPKVLQNVRRLLRVFSEPHSTAGSAVVDAVLATARFLKTQKKAGLFLVFDELGKSLEHAASERGQVDIFLLQQLAEAAAREPDSSLGVLVILHQSFGVYAQRLGQADQAEWQKVAGRFDELPFLEASDQLLAMLSRAIDSTEFKGVSLRKIQARRAGEALSVRRGGKNKAFLQTLVGCFPVDPLAAMLLAPVFRGSLAQNQRTLFSFLTSRSPGGFQDFIDRHPEPEFLYSLDELFGYVSALFATQPQSRRSERVWGLAEAALQEILSESTPEAAQLVRAIALLERFGEDAGLKPDLDTLAMALKTTPERVTALANDLRSFVVPRKFSGTFHLWTGTDVDLERILVEAEQAVENAGDVCAALARHVILRPIIGGRHLSQTGAMRWLEPRLVDETEIDQHTSPETPANGIILYVLPRSRQGQDQLLARLSSSEERAQLLSHPASVVVVAGPDSGLHERASRMLALDHAVRSVQALEGESAVRRELAIQLADAKNEISALLAQEFGWHGHGPLGGRSRWFTQGSGECPQPPSVSRLASTVFDQAFSMSPPVQNELLNRDRLSSAGAKARRVLLERMIEHGSEPQLGLVGHPPEVAMYLAFLDAGGLHAPGTASHPWNRPLSPGFQPCWDGLRLHLEQQGRPVSLKEVYRVLEGPPFGVTKGLLPVLTVALLLAYPDHVSLFEDGSLVPVIDAATAERLTKRPSSFALRAFPVTDERTEFLEELSRRLAPYTPVREIGASLLGVVKQLLRIYRSLPTYALRTSQVPDTAKRLRLLLAAARDPQALIFDLLPEALGFARASSVSSAEVATALDGAIVSLRDAYPDLLSRLRRSLLSVLDASSEDELIARASALPDHGLPSALGALRLRLINAPPDEAWLVAVATLLVQRPPESWTDDEAEGFAVHLAEVGKIFRSFERLMSSAIPGLRRLEVSIQSTDGRSLSEIATVRDGEQVVTQALVKSLRKALDSKHGTTQGQRLAAIAELVYEICETAEANEGEESWEMAKSDTSLASLEVKTAQRSLFTSGTESPKWSTISATRRKSSPKRTNTSPS